MFRTFLVIILIFSTLIITNGKAKRLNHQIGKMPTCSIECDPPYCRIKCIPTSLTTTSTTMTSTTTTLTTMTSTTNTKADYTENQEVIIFILK